MSDLERRLAKQARIRAILTVVTFVILISTVAVSLGITGYVSSQRASRERYASTTMKTLSSAEADFRANDRDWNHVNDFWTADVKSLYTMTSAAVQGGRAGRATDPSIKLIELSTAAADMDDAFVPAAGENVPLEAFSTPVVCQGYWYGALMFDQTLAGTAEMTYRVDTGGSPAMGPCHNTSKFGFVAFPDTESAGRYVFVVNENNTIYRSATTGPVRMGNRIPPGRNGLWPAYQDWPRDAFLSARMYGHKDW